MDIQIGDRVRLTRRMAKTKLAMYKPGDRRVRRDWYTREGVVMQASAGHVSVKWDDCKSLDFWPPKAMERVTVREETKDLNYGC